MGWKETLGVVGRTVANAAMDGVEDGERKIIAREKEIYRDMKHNGASADELKAYEAKMENDKKSYEKMKNRKRF
jgi:hypothetical protein